MKTYEEMLKKARKSIPEGIAEEGRFKISTPQTFIQGNQTIISNFVEIANEMRRGPKHLSKFLFRELAKAGHVEGNRLILQGRVIRSLVEKKLDAYVNEFVLCGECKKPDTHLEKKDRVTILKCEACGARQPVRNI